MVRLEFVVDVVVVDGFATFNRFVRKERFVNAKKTMITITTNAMIIAAIPPTWDFFGGRGGASIVVFSISKSQVS